jgi:hypothetical protein
LKGEGSLTTNDGKASCLSERRLSLAQNGSEATKPRLPEILLSSDIDRMQRELGDEQSRKGSPDWVKIGGDRQPLACPVCPQ